MAQPAIDATCPADFDLLVGISKPLYQYAFSNASKKSSAGSPRDTFFPKLKQDVDTFCRSVKKRKVLRADAMRVARKSIITTLDILSETITDRHLHEQFLCVRGEPPHHKLHALFHISKSEPDRASTLFDFRLVASNKRRQLNAQFALINERLTAGARRSKPPPVMTIDPDDIDSLLHKTPKTVRNHLEEVYDLVAKNWKCEATHSPHTAAKLRLYTYRACKPGKKLQLEIVFTAPSRNSLKTTKFQESTVAYFPEEEAGFHSTKTRPEDLNENGSVSSRKRKVAFVPDSRQESEPPGAIKDGSKLVESGLCRLIQSTTMRTSQRLDLCVHDGHLHFYDIYKPLDEADDVNYSEMITLENLILHNKPLSMQLAKKRPRAILQVIIANAFLQLTNGPWLSTHCTKSKICFFYPKDWDMPDLLRPYLSTCCQLPIDGSGSVGLENGQTDEELLFRGHPYPHLLALGIVLLEIELGQPIEHWRTPEVAAEQQKAETYHIDADFPAAMKMLAQCHQDSHDSFYKAAHACINADAFAAFGRDETLNNRKFRDSIFVNIVQQLETALRSVWEDRNPETLDEFCQAMYRESKKGQMHMARRMFNLSGPVTHTATIDAVSVTGGSVDEGFPMNNLQVVGGGTESQQIGFNGADQWFKTLQHKVLDTIVLFPERKKKKNTIEPPSHSRTMEIFGNQGRIRVAVIDTGLELSKSALLSLDPKDERIKECVSFFNEEGKHDDKDGNPIMIEGFKDLDGHGTHSAALILKVAPTAELYVARVFKSRDEGNPGVTAAHIHERVARAIRHAATVWKVDVVSMSFGFVDPVKIIKEEIDKAASEKIIMVAAPANWGGQKPAAWPACDEKVIDIYATEHFTNRCSFSPTPPPNSEGFATIGIGVESRWPPSLKQGSTNRKDGTSVATAIAAGLAAMTLAYMKQLVHIIGSRIREDDVETFQLIRTSHGMKAMFERMVADRDRRRDGLAFLSPWHYFGSNVTEPALFREPEMMIPYTFLRDMLLQKYRYN